MDSANTKELGELFDNLKKISKSNGIQELNEALTLFFAKKQDNSTEIDFVIQSVADEYSISVRTLKHSTARGQAQEAREVAYCILHLNLGITLRYISKRVFFKSSHTSINRVIVKFKDMGTLQHELLFKEKYNKIKALLATYIINNK